TLHYEVLTESRFRGESGSLFFYGHCSIHYNVCNGNATYGKRWISAGEIHLSLRFSSVFSRCTNSEIWLSLPSPTCIAGLKSNSECSMIVSVERGELLSVVPSRERS